MTQYTPTLGLEIHAQLKTASKMFCFCVNDPDEKRPNTTICPICTGHPGTLPTANREAIRKVLMIGVAVGGTCADFTEFDRKHYFYPDIPKGYQISQYKHPLVTGGVLAGVPLTRIHLEEDTARSTHDRGGESLVDFNRSGLPLMELVTEPEIKSGAQAAEFARELQRLLRYLDAGAANMEKGEMRVEANLSISSSEKLGTKVEVKNLNSFRAVERAVAFEIERHTELLERGESVVQETRGWDEGKQITVSQRQKEESHDYRYLPEPDIPPMLLSEFPEFSSEALRSSLPELPWERRERYRKEFGLSDEQVETLVDDGTLADLFERTVASIPDSERKTLSVKVGNYITSDLVGLLRGDDRSREVPFSAEHFAELMMMIHKGELSSRGGKDILGYMYTGEGSPREIAARRDLLQSSDSESIAEMAREIVAEHADAVAEYRAGKEAALQFLVGQGMKKSKGSANPQVLREALLTELKV